MPILESAKTKLAHFNTLHVLTYVHTYVHTVHAVAVTIALKFKQTLSATARYICTTLHPIPSCFTAHNVLQVHHDLGQELLYAGCKGVPCSPHCGAPGRAHGVAVNLTVVTQALVKGKAL